MKIKNLPDKIIWAAITAYAAFFSYVSILKYNNFIYNDFDLAIDVQVLWNICHGSLYSSIHQMVFLGNHMRVILFLIAPIYVIFQSPILLLVLQSIALGLGAYPIYKIASEELNKKFALIFAFAYLFYPALGYLNLYEFHPVAFAACFLLFMFYYLRKNNFRMFLIFAILAMFCQENIALIIIMSGLYAFISKKSARWIIFPVVLGAIYFWLCIFFIQPHFNNGDISYISLYNHFGQSFPEIIKNIILHPINTLCFILTKWKILFMFQLLGPLCFLSLLSPAVLLISLPLLLQHLLSSRITEWVIYYHYTAELIPFIFISAIYGAKRVMMINIFKNWTIFMVFFTAVILFSNIMLGPHFYYIPALWRTFENDPMDYHRDRLIKLIPEDASVVATFQFQSHLANRKKLYSFHHISTGVTTLSEYANLKIKYDVPEDIEYVLIDFDDPLTFSGSYYGFYRRGQEISIKRFLKDRNFGILDMAERIVLFKKGYKGDLILDDLVENNGKIKVITKHVLSVE